MEKMEGKTESLEMVNENNGRLLTELDSLVNKLQISYEHQVSTYISPLISFALARAVDPHSFSLRDPDPEGTNWRKKQKKLENNNRRNARKLVIIVILF